MKWARAQLLAYLLLGGAYDLYLLLACDVTHVDRPRVQGRQQQHSSRRLSLSVYTQWRLGRPVVKVLPTRQHRVIILVLWANIPQNRKIAKLI